MTKVELMSKIVKALEDEKYSREDKFNVDSKKRDKMRYFNDGIDRAIDIVFDVIKGDEEGEVQ